MSLRLKNTMVIDGVQWYVDRVGDYCRTENPRISGINAIPREYRTCVYCKVPFTDSDIWTCWNWGFKEPHHWACFQKAGYVW